MSRSADPYKRHKTRHRGIAYRLRADGSRTYFVWADGCQVKVGGGETEALALQAELRGRRARGERIRPKNVQLLMLAEEWFASRDDFREPTRRDYRSALDRRILPRFGHLKVGGVTADEIAAMIRELRAEGLSGSTIKNALKPLQGTMKLALRRGLIFQNPFDLLETNELPKEAPREQHEWSRYPELPLER